MRKVCLASAAIVAAVGACGEGSRDDMGADAAGALPPDVTSNTDAGGPSVVARDASTSAAPGDAGPASPPPPKVDVTNETLEIFGEPRTFVLVAPKVYDPAKSYPLVMVFHGDGGNGAGMRASYRYDDQTGDAAFVVYPDSKAGFSWDLYTPEAQNPDNAFMVAIVAALVARFPIDTARVFGTGYSSGAFFINQLACRKTGFFRAIAPNAGGAPREPQDPSATYWKTDYTKCANQTGGVAAIVFHGTDDTTVVPESGDFTAQYWAFVNGCDEAKESRIATNPAPCTMHASCPAGQPVVYCPIPNIGHGAWIESAKTSWTFFQSL